MAETPTGWQLLHSKLPPAAIKPLATAVYGVAGLSDVNEGYLIQRLFASGLTWDWRIVKQEFIAAEDRGVKDKDYTQRYYIAAVHGELTIDGRTFHGSGASDNRRPDAAYKGAATVAFKSACKFAGLTAELYLDGRAIDHIYQGRVTKDPDMAPATVDQAFAAITETYGDPAQPAQSTAPLVELPSTDGAVIASAVPASDEPVPVQVLADLIDDGDVRQPLYVLARTLKEPRTVLEVNNKIAKQGIGPVRMELILAHGRDCKKTPCEHVAALAGLA
jgi:hypothetical protein